MLLVLVKWLWIRYNGYLSASNNTKHKIPVIVSREIIAYKWKEEFEESMKGMIEIAPINQTIMQKRRSVTPRFPDKLIKLRKDDAGWIENARLSWCLPIDCLRNEDRSIRSPDFQKLIAVRIKNAYQSLNKENVFWKVFNVRAFKNLNLINSFWQIMLIFVLMLFSRKKKFLSFFSFIIVVTF